MNRSAAIKLAMIEEKASHIDAHRIFASVVEQAGLSRLVLAADMSWDTKITPDNLESALSWLGGNKNEPEEKEADDSEAIDGDIEEPEPEDFENTSDGDELSAIRSEIGELRKTLNDIQKKENKELDLMNRMVDMVTSLLSAKPARKKSKKASQSDVDAIARDYIRLAKNIISFSGDNYRHDPKHENKPSGEWHKTKGGWSKSEEDGEEKEQEKPEDTTNEDMSEVDILADIAPADKDVPSWVDKDKPIDTKNVEDMKGRGFTEAPADTNVDENTILTDVKTGKSYKFGDLSSAIQGVFRKRLQDGQVMKAPAETKSEDLGEHTEAEPEEVKKKTEELNKKSPVTDEPDDTEKTVNESKDKKTPSKDDGEVEEVEGETVEEPVEEVEGELVEESEATPSSKDKKHKVAPSESLPDEEIDMSEFEAQFKQEMPKAKEHKTPEEFHNAVLDHVEKNMGAPKEEVKKKVNEAIKKMDPEKKKELANGGKSVEEVYTSIVQDAAKQTPPPAHKTKFQKDSDGNIVPPQFVGSEKFGYIPWNKLGKDAQNTFIEDAKNDPDVLTVSDTSNKKKLVSKIASRLTKKIFAEETLPEEDEEDEEKTEESAEEESTEEESTEEVTEEEPTEETTEETTEEEPTEETTEESTEETTEEPADESTEETTEESTEEPTTDELADELAETLTKVPTEEESIEETTEQPTEEPTEQPAEQDSSSQSTGERKMTPEQIEQVVDKIMEKIQPNGPPEQPANDGNEGKGQPDDSGSSDVDKALADEIDRLVLASAIRSASQGLQMNRKDVDTMKDTGGSSKRRYEPKVKPPRDDVRKPFSTKNKKTDNHDSDTDSDPDMKG